MLPILGVGAFLAGWLIWGGVIAYRLARHINKGKVSDAWRAEHRGRKDQ